MPGEVFGLRDRALAVGAVEAAALLVLPQLAVLPLNTISRPNLVWLDSTWSMWNDCARLRPPWPSPGPASRSRFRENLLERKFFFPPIGPTCDRGNNFDRKLISLKKRTLLFSFQHLNFSEQKLNETLLRASGIFTQEFVFYSNMKIHFIHFCFIHC